MKKFVCAVSAAIAAVSALAMVGCGGTAEVNYTLSDDGTYYIVSGVSGNRSSLKNYEIPSTYGDENLPVKRIGADAFRNCTLYSVIIPDSVNVIGARAFMGSKLLSVEIPDGVTAIKAGAFAQCKSLTEVTVPESVTELGIMAFAYCTSLERAYLKCQVEYLPDGLLENSVASSGGNTFTDTKLTQVYISSSVKKINVTAFKGNFVTDIYYAGSEQEWSRLYFYTFEQVEGKEEPVEKQIEKSEALPDTLIVHCNYIF